MAEKPTKVTDIERAIMRPFRRNRDKPVILFALEGFGPGWGIIDFKYRDLFIRADAEKGYAVAFIALSDSFSPTWYFHHVLTAVTGFRSTYMSARELSSNLLRHYEAILQTISTEAGRERVASLQDFDVDKSATESAKLRDSAEQASLAVGIKDAQRFERELWGPTYRAFAIRAGLVVCTGFLIFVCLVWRP
jgi:hypothetical protein